jgi:hypothetical protein
MGTSFICPSDKSDTLATLNDLAIEDVDERCLIGMGRLMCLVRDVRIERNNDDNVPAK